MVIDRPSCGQRINQWRLWFSPRALRELQQGGAPPAPNCWCCTVPVALLPRLAATNRRGRWWPDGKWSAGRAERDRKVAATLQAAGRKGSRAGDQLLVPPDYPQPPQCVPIGLWALTGAGRQSAWRRARRHTHPTPGAQAACRIWDAAAFPGAGERLPGEPAKAL